MSETVRYSGKIQLRPRLENETDKEYFERVTGVEWEVEYAYPEPHKDTPENLSDALYEHNLSYWEAKKAKKGYVILNNSLYEFIKFEEKCIEESYCTVEDLGDNIFSFDTQYYNGGCDLSEMLGDSNVFKGNEE